MQIYHSALKSFPTLSTPNTPKAADAASITQQPCREGRAVEYHRLKGERLSYSFIIGVKSDQFSTR